MATGFARPIVLLLAAVAVSCAPQSAGPARSPGNDPPAPLAPARTLEMAISTEPLSLAQKALGGGAGTNFATTRRAFNATLGIFDGEGVARPYLVETLPQLDTVDWRIFPDGRMETTYHLKSNLTWHDGAPLTGEDFVFAWQVYTSPRVGIGTGSPQNRIAEVVAPDAHTVLIYWKVPYPEAGVLDESKFPPLPGHVLGPAFLEDPGSLESQPQWKSEYIGAGPYRLVRWEPGAFVEGAAFDGHALGRAKIDRIRIAFIADANAALSALLAGHIQTATDISLKFEQALILEREWVPQAKGVVLYRTGSYHSAWFQHRPDWVDPRVLRDIRVRRALAHSLNRDDVNAVVFEGRGIMTEVPFIPPSSSYFPEAERAVAKYSYDVRMTGQLMADAGFRKVDGVYASPAGGPLRIDLRTLVSAERQKEQSILTAGWRKAGFDFSESLLPAAQSSDGELRATFPGIFTFTTTGGEYGLAGFTTAAIPSRENRWAGGSNRPGWSNEEFDRLAAAFAGAIASADRVRYVGQLARLMTEEVANIPISFSLGVEAHASSVVGPQSVAQESLIPWNLHEWELR